MIITGRISNDKKTREKLNDEDVTLVYPLHLIVSTRKERKDEPLYFGENRIYGCNLIRYCNFDLFTHAIIARDTLRKCRRANRPSN